MRATYSALRLATGALATAQHVVRKYDYSEGQENDRMLAALDDSMAREELAKVVADGAALRVDQTIEDRSFSVA